MGAEVREAARYLSVWRYMYLSFLPQSGGKTGLGNLSFSRRTCEGSCTRRVASAGEGGTKNRNAGLFSVARPDGIGLWDRSRFACAWCAGGSFPEGGDSHWKLETDAEAGDWSDDVFGKRGVFRHLF